jgi:hypothetical protein
MDEPAQCFPLDYAAAADVARCDVVRCCFSMMDAEVERIIICEGCKKVTWLKGLFNIYKPIGAAPRWHLFLGGRGPFGKKGC